MVAINDPMREEIYNSMFKMGRERYCQNEDTDNSPNLRKAVDSLILSFYECPVSKLFIKALLPPIPQQEQYTDIAVRSFLQGVQDAATGAGHLKNAEYVSRAIKKLNERG